MHFNSRTKIVVKTSLLSLADVLTSLIEELVSSKQE